MNLFGAVHAAVVGAQLTHEHATHALVTPSMLHRLDLAPGTVVTVAGGPLHRRAIPEGPDGPDVRHYYGAAELSFVAAGRDAESLRAFPGVSVEVRDGEIWAHSPYLSDGYLDGTGPLRMVDGWGCVGDRGRLVDGRLEVLGRAGAVTTAGHTVVLAEVEAALRPATVAEIVAFGLPHDVVGEVLCVAVAGTQADLDDVRRSARALSAGARPRRWFLLDTPLPLTPSGKIDRAAVMARCGA